MDLRRILNAESVAIVGASKVVTKRGYQAIKTLLDEKYEGSIYPVNPKEKRVLGLTCYPDLAAIPGVVDIALITTPAHTVPELLKACGQKGIAGAVIIAGGFRETGEEGVQLENQIIESARQHKVRLIGPNTSGMMNLKTNLNLVGLKGTRSGDIALLSQSGNMALSLITEAKIKSLKGYSYYVGVGNEADIRFHEYLEFFRQDPGTRAIVMYVEGMHQGREFLIQAYKTTIDKPIILLKSGRSSKGKQSAGSHTGALAGISEVSNTAFRRAGIVVIENSDELFPAAETLSSLPPIRNNSVAILADGGGHATIAADLLTDLGMHIPELNEKTQAKLRKILPAGAAVRNPVDVAGGTDAEPALMAECAKIIMKDPQVGGLLIAGLFGGYGIRFSETLSLQEEDAAHQMGKIVKKQEKPIIVHSLYTFEKPHSLHLLRYYNIPVYDSLDIACKCIGVLGQYGEYLRSYHAKTNFILNPDAKRKPQGVSLIEEARQRGNGLLLEIEGKQLLALHGAPIALDKSLTPNGRNAKASRHADKLHCRSFLAKTADEAVNIAKHIDSAVAMKIISPDILHKSDAKGVRLNIRTEKEIRDAFKSIMEHARQYAPHADIRGVSISPMASAGLEVIIGTKIDDQFGPVIMYGLGGIMVEILKDVSFRVVPISRRSAKKMIEDTKSFPILNGARGQAPYDKKALEDLLLTCSEVVESYPEIQEMDLNPVILHEKGLSIVDVRIILKKITGWECH
ncbi:MAG: acetate--CoA ligase family protein [Desulfobacterales bacterium]|jgi:acetyltransferase|nr:acetate--CoA ligase family protein [Desulfobacterales bacterium]